jgi:type 1 glutamine amidotransferase
LGQVINRAGAYDENDPLYGMRSTDSEVAGIEVEEKDGVKTEFNRNEPMMPVAWTKSYQVNGGKKGKAFASTIGAATDLLSEGTRRLLINGVFWCLDRPVPEKANVDIIGTYNPSPFMFQKDEYWMKKKLSISSLE